MRLLRHKKNLVFTRALGDIKAAEAIEGFSFQIVDAVALDKYFSAKEDAERRKSYESFLADDCIGFLFTHEDTWAAVAWLAPPESPQPHHLPRHVSRRHWWAFHDHTKEDFRGYGLHKALVNRRLTWLTEMAHHSAPIATDINPMNEPSIRSYTGNGFRPSGTVTSTTTPLLRGVAWGAWDTTDPHFGSD